MFQTTTTNYISTEGGKRMRVDPDNSGRSTSAPSQGVARGDAKRRKIDASPDHGAIQSAGIKIEIEAEDPPSNAPAPQLSQRSSYYRKIERGAKLAKEEVSAEHNDAIPFKYPPAQPSRSINKKKKPSSKRGHSDSDGESEAGLPPTKKSRGVILDTLLRSDETSDANPRPTKKIQMEDVHVVVEEAQNTVDRINPLGAKLPPVQELSVQISATCTSRQFKKGSLPANFLTETEEEVILVDPVEEEACEEEEMEEEDVVIPNAMGESEAATKIQAVWRSYCHVVDEDNRLEPVDFETAADKSFVVILDTPLVSKKTRINTKRTHSPAEGQVSDSPTRKRSRKSSAGLAAKEADDDNNDDCNYQYSSESSNEDSSQEDSFSDEEEGELLWVNFIYEASTDADVLRAAATKIQSQFRGHAVRCMKPRSRPLEVPNAAADENDDDESVNGDGTANEAALRLVQMRSNQDSACHSFDSNDEESNGFSAADDVEDDDIESVDFEGTGNTENDDEDAEAPLLLVQMRRNQVSAHHSFHSNDEESKDFSAADNVEDNTSTTAEEATPPTKRRRSLERLKSNLYCRLDGDYWTKAPTRRVIIRRG